MIAPGMIGDVAGVTRKRGRSGFDPRPFRIPGLLALEVLPVGSSRSRPSPAPVAGAAAELEVGWIEGPGEAACLPSVLVPFYQLPGQFRHWNPDLRRDAGVLSGEFFFESCLANVHRELSSSGMTNAAEQSLGMAPANLRKGRVRNGGKVLLALAQPGPSE